MRQCGILGNDHIPSFFVLFLFRFPINQINDDADVRLTLVIGDMVERHFLRAMIASTGRCSCEFCIALGAPRVGSTHWPYDISSDAEMRTHEHFLEVARYHIPWELLVNLDVMLPSLHAVVTWYTPVVTPSRIMASLGSLPYWTSRHHSTSCGISQQKNST